jgi:hypothetical protein
MATYRYLLANVLTGSLLAEVPFESASFSHILNAPGAFSGILGLKQPAELEIALEPLLSPATSNLGKLALYVERDGVIVWGGMLWTSGDVDFDAGTMPINGEGFLSYFRRRVLREKKTYTQQDQTTGIAKDLIDWAQAVTGGDIGIDTSDVAASGVLRDRTYEAFERKNIGEAIEQLAAVQNGFDFRFQSDWSGGSIVTRFLTIYPNTGRQTNYVLEVGSQMSNLSVKVDATSLATNVDVIGAGEGDVGLIAPISDPSLIGVYPVLDEVESHTDVQELPTLDAFARRRLMLGKTPIVIPSVEVDPALEPVLGSYVVGDIMRVRGGSGLASIDGRFRVMEIKVSVNDLGGEQASLAFAGLESFT